MSVLSVVWFLLACSGHAALYVVQINWLYGTRHRGLWIPLIRHVYQALIVVGPPLFLWFWGKQALLDNDWLALPGALLLYLLACWFLGLVFLYQTLRRCLRNTPELQLANHTATVDMAQVLGRKPHGQGSQLVLARLPFNQIFKVDFTELQFRLPRLPRAWDGLSILHVTDLHLCGIPDLPFFEAVMDRLAAEPADIVAVTGDILDSDEHYHWVKPVLGRVRWKLAAFVILGNHDARLDWKRIEREVEELGMEMVGHRWKQVPVRGQTLTVIGNEMPWIPPAPDLTDCPAGGFRLGLSHTPDQFPWAQEQQIDLLLAGHNHGGQIRFPLVGPVLVPSKFSRRYDHGAFYQPPTLLYVGRGLSGTHPLRYGCRPEITRIVLRPL
jgi:hypothetical protein